MKTLVVCFSGTGRTAEVGRAIAERMDADFELIEDVDDTTSPWKKMMTFVTILSRGVRQIRPANDTMVLRRFAEGRQQMGGNCVYQFQMPF